jgi:hypothetical protein
MRRVAGFSLAVALFVTSAVPVFAADSIGAGGKKKNCTAGYSPCITRGSDVDCFGGSGNGPRYTKPGVVYRVTGSDPYGLDSDNDGRGCERN